MDMQPPPQPRVPAGVWTWFLVCQYTPTPAKLKGLKGYLHEMGSVSARTSCVSTSAQKPHIAANNPEGRARQNSPHARIHGQRDRVAAVEADDDDGELARQEDLSEPRG